MAVLKTLPSSHSHSHHINTNNNNNNRGRRRRRNRSTLCASHNNNNNYTNNSYRIKNRALSHHSYSHHSRNNQVWNISGNNKLVLSPHTTTTNLDSDTNNNNTVMIMRSSRNTTATMNPPPSYRNNNNNNNNNSDTSDNDIVLPSSTFRTISTNNNDNNDSDDNDSDTSTRVQVLSHSPLIIYIHNILDHEKCDALVRGAIFSPQFMSSSQTGHNNINSDNDNSDTKKLRMGRTSSSLPLTQQSIYSNNDLLTGFRSIVHVMRHTLSQFINIDHLFEDNASDSDSTQLVPKAMQRPVTLGDLRIEVWHSNKTIQLS